MSPYIIAGLTIALATGPASAVDLGLGVGIGSVGVNAGVSLGDKGASVGLGASVDGVADVDASAGTSGGSIGVGLGSTGGTAGGGGAASGASGSGGKAGGSSPSSSKSASGSGSRSGTTRAVTTAVDPLQASGFPLTTRLPPSLRPHGDGTRGESPPDLVAVSGTPNGIVRTCRQAIRASAVAFGATDVRAVSAGSLHHLSDDVVAAPLVVRIRYAVEDGIEVRQAKIRCHLDASARVIAVQ